MRLWDRDPGAAAASLRGALLVTAAILTLGAGQALAQRRGAALVELAQATPSYVFAIPAAPLPQALNAFGRVTGLTILFTQEGAVAAQSPGVSGELTAEAALARLLAGTGWTYRFTNARTVTLTAAGDMRLGAGVLELPPVDITAGRGASPTGTIGVPPPAYAGGQVGSGARLGLLGNRSVFDTPFAVTSYTGQLIEDQQARSIADVTANDPSVRSLLQRSSFSDQFFIRGFGYFPFDIGFDGLYGLVDIRRPMLENIERVELLRGPSSFLNGVPPLGGGIGGSINLVPKRGTDTPVTRLTIGFASRGELGTLVDVGRRYGANREWGVRFTGAYRSGDGAVDRTSRDYGSAALGLDYRGERFRFSADIGHQDEQLNGTTQQRNVAAGVTIPRAPSNRINVGQPWEYFDHSNTYAVVRGEYDITDSITAFAAYGVNRYSERSLVGPQNIINTAGDTTSTINAGGGLYQNQSGEAGLRARFRTGPLQHLVSLSASIIDRPFDNYSFVAASNIRSNIYDPVLVPRPVLAGQDLRRNSLSISRGVAIADTISILDERIALTIGGRLQTIIAKSFSRAGATTSAYDEQAFTPSVGLVVRPIERLSLYGNYIEALQQGSTAPTGSVNVGEVLAPFIGRQYEVGAKYDFGSFGLGLAAFDIEQQSAFTDPATRRFAADGRQRNRGFEVSVFGEPLANLRLLGGITLLDAKLERTLGGATDGKTAPGVADVQLNLYGEYDLPFAPGLTVTGRAIHTSSQYYDPANTQSIPSWTRFDLGARYTFQRPGGQPVTLRAAVENIADRNYWAATGRGFLTPGAPRTYLFSATFDF